MEKELYNRIARLERRLRVTTLGWLVVAIVVSVLYIGAQQAQSQQSTISAHKFSLVDDNGRERIALNMSTNGQPGIWVYDASGTERIFVGFDADRTEPLLLFHDEHGKQRVFLGFGKEGELTPQLNLFGQRGQDQIYMGWSLAEQPEMNIKNVDGTQVWGAP
jgi:hypothetical protein